MDDTSAQRRVVFTAGILSAVIYGVYASIFVAHGGMGRASGNLAVLVLCLVVPLIGFALKKAFPVLREYATGVMLSPFPGAITYLFASLWMAIS
ncbi:hypothetical protein BKG83_00200 [Mycobacteroides chelonae]|jgi:hypothetical protein|uniref:EamA family transporter n=1 Tax=Mycobacteroides chelonae TaxID=1774 RepID=A0A1S1LXI6_MYCCH|nr:hypothetical protein [Mycobacteroides chelonae]PKQ56859.1 hypothetical protein B5566_16850 [Mycobacterium sp. MHSD3]SKN55116.1 Uncharacterised protein [Mycobacteroides abscessus subsp. bolletii]MBF9522554.1 hypothetical protein [Mycobacteroides chelonae]OHU60570.1 hypothetical protein BKG83_00200 [Mycobacteroides chelonae]OHU75816.1 hypothetical protein BKG84_26490 [Mycobacteroides chelonae]